jgi:hypothetical protein
MIQQLVIAAMFLICYDLFIKDQVRLTLGLEQLAWMGLPSELTNGQKPTFGSN